MKSKVFRFILALAVVFLIFAVVTPAFAQEGGPTGTEDVAGFTIPWQEIWDWLILIGQFVLIAALLGYGAGVTTEGLKDLLRWLTANPLLKFAFPDGGKSGGLAFLISLAIAKGYDVTLFEDIPMFQDLLRNQPYLITLTTAAVTWMLANFAKRQDLTDYVYQAKPTAAYGLDGIPNLGQWVQARLKKPESPDKKP